jgi:hypothetical protein
MSENENDCVEFGNKGNAAPGAISGAVIAVGVTAATLVLGKGLESRAQLTIILVGIGVGGLISLTATFFGLVIPSKVNGGCGCGKSSSSEGAQNSVSQTF